jgi:hypothetical protein
MQKARKYTKEDYLRIVAIIQEKIDPDELADMARASASFEEFSDIVLDTVLARVEWGWEGIQSAWPNPVIQEFLEEVYREARAGLPEEEIPPPPAEKPSLWDRIKRGIRRIFGR